MNSVVNPEGIRTEHWVKFSDLTPEGKLERCRYVSTGYCSAAVSEFEHAGLYIRRECYDLLRVVPK